jgi:drug/metabolite transporter (DMT)-like permease
VAFLIPALVTHQTAQITVKSGLLVLYLIIFGGIVAYSSYLYAMKNLPVSLVSIYIYVNPLVAVTLGWFLFGQGLGTLGIIGMFVVFAGILIVKRNSVRPGHEGN